MTQVGGGAGHGQVCRTAMRQRGEHGSDPAKIHIGYTDADGYCRKDHQYIFQNADPSDCPNTAGKNEGHQQNDRNRHGWCTADAIEAGDRDDNTYSGDLELQVRNKGCDTNDADKSGQILVAITGTEEVGLSLHFVLLADLPDLGQDKE
jgi:hypothetical protein